MDVEKAWYYADADGSPTGPHPRRTLETLRASGTISPETLVWTEGMGDWATYAASGIEPPSSPATPPPLRPRSNASSLAAPDAAESPAEHQPDAGIRSPYPDARDQVEPLTPSAWRDRREALAHGGPGAWDGLALESGRRPPELAVEDDGWQSTKPAPWRRYFARILDTMIFGFLSSAVMAASMGVLDPALFEKFYGRNGLFQNAVLATLFVLIVAMPFEALVIGLTGTSIGKWIFGVRITRKSGRPIGFARSLGREVGVWFYGFGLGVPVVSLITLIVSYLRLKDQGVARWDAGRPWLVTYRPSGTLQWILSVSGFLCWIGLLVGFSILGARR